VAEQLGQLRLVVGADLFAGGAPFGLGAHGSGRYRLPAGSCAGGPLTGKEQSLFARQACRWCWPTATQILRSAPTWITLRPIGERSRRHCAQRQRLGPITQRDSHTSEPRIRGAGYALRVDGEFVAAGRRGTAGSGASPWLVFSCPGRVACGAPAGAQFRGLGRGRSCRWPCRAVGGRASGVDVAAGPRSAS
jgi:hypothetical protein